MNWDDVRVFLAVAEEGSFRKAAARLNIGHTTLSRRIESLEHSVGTRLFVRQSTGLTLTEAGEEMLTTAKPMNAEFDDLLSRLFGQEQVPRGSIRATIPSMVLNYVLADYLPAFYAAWPGITLEIDTTLHLLNLHAREADLAVRMTSHPGDELIGRRVGKYCEAVYATPEYLDQYQQRRSAVAGAGHHWIRPSEDYAFVGNLLPAYSCNEAPEVVVTAPDPESQMALASRHMGIATLPCIMASHREDFVRISDVYERSDIWLLSHKDTRGNKRMQLFRDFLVNVFEENESRFLGL